MLQKFRCVEVPVLLCILCLLNSCGFAGTSEVANSNNKLEPSDSSGPDSFEPRITVDISKSDALTKTKKDPSEYRVLGSDKEFLEFLDYNTEYGWLYVDECRIESFEFINDVEYLTRLILSNCYIPEGVTIPRTAALNHIVSIELIDIYGSGAADVLIDCLPLPTLEILSLCGQVTNKQPLAYTPSLTDIIISIPDPFTVISNNTHISGALEFDVHLDTDFFTAETINGVGAFKSIQFLRLPKKVSDISPIAYCESLRILDATNSEKINSLSPLRSLDQLEEILISYSTYESLPDSDKLYYNVENNSNADAVHVYIAGYYKLDEADEYLRLENQSITSFDFLEDFPNLKTLSIFNCEIADNLILPRINSLTYLSVEDPNVLAIISQNQQIAGRLQIGTGYTHEIDNVQSNIEPLTDLPGLDEFIFLESLTITDPVIDISALSSCKNLRALSLFYCTSLESIQALSSLSRFRLLVLPKDVFISLPKEEQSMFDNWKSYMPSISWRD